VEPTSARSDIDHHSAAPLRDEQRSRSIRDEYRACLEAAAR
jgi:hypothetical protein